MSFTTTALQLVCSAEGTRYTGAGTTVINCGRDGGTTHHHAGAAPRGFIPRQSPPALLQVSHAVIQPVCLVLESMAQ